jgi:endo-1,4-beta-mannosidase
MMRLKSYSWTDIEVGSYRKPQEVQMISTIVEYLQGIQTAKEAAAPDKNRLGNLANNNKHFTRANNTYMRCTMYSNTL